MSNKTKHTRPATSKGPQAPVSATPDAPEMKNETQVEDQVVVQGSSTEPEQHVQEMAHAPAEPEGSNKVDVIETQSESGNAVTFQGSGAFNKAEKAREIFNDIGKTQPRKAVIARLKAEAHLTDHGAATYYQNMKKAAGMVTAKKTDNGPAARAPR